MMKCATLFFKGSKRGSAIIMALVTMTLLVTLGLALIVVSMGNLNVNVADATNNDVYYAAEAGVNSALEQVKFEVTNYYNSMLQAQGTNYTDLYNNFFAGIKANAQSDFIEPGLSGISTKTTFTQGTYNPADNTCEYLVSSTSTADDGSKYKVSGSVTIKRVDVQAGGGWTVPDRAITAGGTLNLGNTNGINVSGGNVDVASLVRKDTWQLGVSNGQLIIDPNVGLTLKDTKKYPSYTNPVITSPTMNITQNNIIIKSVTGSPVQITSAAGINVTFDGCTIPSGTIYIKGNVTITGGSCAADVYCDGTFTGSNFTMNGDVYCRGNATLSSVAMKGETTSDGAVSATSGSFVGTIYGKNGITVNNASSTGSMFSPQAITISHAGVSNGIIYSSTKINYGNSSTTCLLFSGGDICITGGATVCGSITAKGSIYCVSDSNIWLSINYSKSNLESIFADQDNTFFTSNPTPVLNQNVFMNQSVTADGRVS